MTKPAPMPIFPLPGPINAGTFAACGLQRYHSAPAGVWFCRSLRIAALAVGLLGYRSIGHRARPPNRLRRPRANWKRLASTPFRQPQVRPGQPAQWPEHGLPDGLGVPPCRTAARGHQGIRGLAAGARCRGCHGMGLQSLLSGRRTALVLPWELKAGAPPPQVPIRTSDSEHSDVVANVEAGVIANLHGCDGRWCRVTVDAYTRLHRAEKALGRLRGRDNKVVDGGSRSPTTSAPAARPHRCA